jgi:hypothetical protein
VHLLHLLEIIDNACSLPCKSSILEWALNLIGQSGLESDTRLTYSPRYSTGGSNWSSSSQLGGVPRLGIQGLYLAIKILLVLPRNLGSTVLSYPTKSEEG